MSQIHVDQREHHQTLAAVLRRRLNLSWSAAKAMIENKLVRIGSQVCPDPARRIKLGQIIYVASVNEKKSKAMSRSRLRPVQPKTVAIPDGIVVRHADDDILVVEKPAGLTTMRHREEAAEFGARGKKFLPRTLADFLPMVVNDDRPIIPVHRIDKDTSGIVVFARTAEAAKHLGRQFRNHVIERIYLAIVRGRPHDGRIESWLVRDRGDGRRGSGIKATGERAVTHVKLLKQLGQLSLVECRLETGRTHQIRIHLGEAGWPLAGENIYDRPLHGKPVADPSGAQRVLLHAAVLGFKHPSSGRLMRWESVLPKDMSKLVVG